jgi:hypothetical protein
MPAVIDNRRALIVTMTSRLVHDIVAHRHEDGLHRVDEDETLISVKRGQRPDRAMC